MSSAIESVFTLWRFLRLKTSLILIKSASSQWTSPYLHYFLLHPLELACKARPSWAAEITSPYLHYFAQELLVRLLDVHGSFLFVLHSNKLHNQDTYYDILFDILCGDSSSARFSGFLIGLLCISYLCGISFSPILFCELVGILSWNNTPDSLHGDYNGIYGRNVGRWRLISWWQSFWNRKIAAFIQEVKEGGRVFRR